MASTSSVNAATLTPLASIFGSGFLIIVPILAGAVGPYSVVAMLGVTSLAYAVGSVVRFNIRTAEPALEAGTASHKAEMVDRTSDFAIVAAYAISVCLYLRILSSFLLTGLGVDSPLRETLLTVSLIAAIGLVGFFKGLDLLEGLEKWALLITLGIVALLLVSFAWYDFGAVGVSGLVWPEMPDHSWWEILTILGGTLIVVQGFETSRFLSSEFDTETRVRSCRRSQLISMAVYLVFVALATPLMHFLGTSVDDNGLIMLAGKVFTWLPIPLVGAAVLSQFSAAVADTIGGGGNLDESTKGHIDARHAYLLICAAAAALTLLPTLTILALASRAFAFFYLLQCLVALGFAKGGLQRAGLWSLVAILGFITLFAVPAG